MNTTSEPKVKTPRLTTTEKRAAAYMERAKQAGRISIAMHWKKSRDYGLCPVIYSHTGEKCAYAGGCGYDKESACLAELLRFLFPYGSEPHTKIHSASGAGFGRVRDALALHGWELRHAYNGKTEDGYELTRIA